MPLATQRHITSAQSLARFRKTQTGLGDLSWAKVDSPTVNDLNAIDFLEEKSAWAVGGRGTIIRWDGSDWKTVKSPTRQTLYSVKAVAEDDVWAVGNGGVILRWNGSSWRLIKSPTHDILHSLAFLSPTDGWAIANATQFIHWDGVSWSRVIPEPYLHPLSAIAFVNSNEGWAVGIAAKQGGISQWIGGAWSMYSVSEPSWLLDVQAVVGGSVWAVGGYHVAQMIGNGWHTTQLPFTMWLTAIGMSSDRWGWAVGMNGALVHWNGATWNQVASPVQLDFGDVQTLSETDAWIVGKEGTILRYKQTINCNPQAEGLILFDQPNFQGNCFTVSSSVDDLSSIEFDNSVRSIKYVGAFAAVEGRWVAVLFDGKQRKGEFVTVLGSIEDLGEVFGGKTSSILLQDCLPGQCALKQYGQTQKVKPKVIPGIKECVDDEDWLLTFDIRDKPEWQNINPAQLRYWIELSPHLGNLDEHARVESIDNDRIQLCLGIKNSPAVILRSIWIWLAPPPR